MNLEEIFKSIGWKLARKVGDEFFYMSEESIRGYQPCLKLEDGDWDLEQIVALIVFQAYLDGMNDSGQSLMKDVKNLLKDSGLH